MGKTSLLNAFKLLFLGAESVEMRTIGFPPSTMPVRAYVLGDGAGWNGIINRRARRRLTASGEKVAASVGARWEMPDGLVVTAKRTWTVTATGWEEFLRVGDDRSNDVTQEEAAARLDDFIPREFVSFFFFDGEDIKRLAEMTERKAIDFDRLLRITFVAELASQLQTLATERGRGRLSDDLNREILDCRLALTRAEESKKLTSNKLAALDDEIGAVATELRRLSVRRENLGTGASDARLADHAARQIQLRLSVTRLEEDVAGSVPSLAPMLANLQLIGVAKTALEERVEAIVAADDVLARRIQVEMAEWIAGAPVAISSEEAIVLAKDINDHIEALLRRTEGTGPFAELDAARAERMFDVVQKWSIGGPGRLGAQIDKLMDLRRLRKELADITQEMLRLEVGSQANLEQYRAVVAEMETKESHMSELNQAKGSLRSRNEEAKRLETELGERLIALKKKESDVLKTSHEAGYILRLATAMFELREALRKTIRNDMQEAINDRFRTLARGHSYIHRIEIDDIYTMNFFDKDDNKIGRASLSSGIKQLAATALLWAMKDLVGRDMPVMIDTPLGRIDRENQNAMLTNYYPKLAHQVIVLPTDSEIDSRKRALLDPFVAADFTIDNPFGDGARIVPQTSLVTPGDG